MTTTLQNTELMLSGNGFYVHTRPLGRSAESWLAMQAQYDLWTTEEPKLKKIDFSQFEEAA